MRMIDTGEKNMGKIFVFHGVNLHLLGVREPDIYGNTGLDELNAKIMAMGTENGMSIECRQTNYEGEMIGWITSLKPDDFLILNPGPGPIPVMLCMMPLKA